VKLSFILNGEDLEMSVPAEKRLCDILRDIPGIQGARPGCLDGVCGACSVLFKAAWDHDRKSYDLVKSCLVPAFKVQNAEITTIEGFSQTEDYQQIVRGFDEAGLVCCDFCRPARILAAEALLSRTPSPSRDDVLTAFGGVRCRCTDAGALLRGIQAAAACRQGRIYGRP